MPDAPSRGASPLTRPELPELVETELAPPGAARPAGGVPPEPRPGSPIKVGSCRAHPIEKDREHPWAVARYRSSRCWTTRYATDTTVSDRHAKPPLRHAVAGDSSPATVR